uniref:Uncharacterized protein n=1 Tax=Angiostrongylus cantonensis TaxID=6313 RepID=C7TNY0_ANGCA|nr:hypothetical protein [Angiostrongylus cantonensis]
MLIKLNPFTSTVLLSQSLVHKLFFNILRNKCDVCELGNVEEHMFNGNSFYSQKLFRLQDKNVFSKSWVLVGDNVRYFKILFINLTTRA